MGCTPIAEGARGRARCRKESVPTAMLGNFLWCWEGLGKASNGVMSSNLLPSSSLPLWARFDAKIRIHVPNILFEDLQEDFIIEFN